MIDDHRFAVCLTHDVDRPYKGVHQALYYAVTDRSLSHLEALLPSHNPYWQYDDIMALEAELGVSSAFYFLNEPNLLLDRPPREWLQPNRWVEHLGRYDLASPDVRNLIQRLDAGGWEVGLHGSYGSSTDTERLRHEKQELERVLGEDIYGGRQHHLRLEVPETWQVHREIGLRYDASFGSSTEYGFDHGRRPFAPFGDEFVVFPLTLMEQTLEGHASFEQQWQAVERLLQQAAETGAVITTLWHPRYFNESEFPGFRRLYRRLIERALELGGWVGPPRDFYESTMQSTEPERAIEGL